VSTPGFCPQCGVAALQEAIRCTGCEWMLPAGDDPHSARGLARALSAALGDGYAVIEEIGRGGFARVFRVHDIGLDRWLAAKVVAPELTTSAEIAERFRREAMTVARLVHPNIVPILFVPATPDMACYVMPLVDGESLAARLDREGAQPMVVAVSIAQDVAGALDVAHAAGIVHRDVKPDNILLEHASGRALLADFGIAKAADQQGRITSSGFVLGTPQYIAPEQAAGERALDARTDEYALAVVVFEMLAGRPPFTAPNAQALYALHVIAPVPDVRELRPEVPAAVAQALTRALAKDPAHRYPGAGTFAEALVAGLGRRSLRTSNAAVVDQVGADDVRLFRTTSASAAGDPGAAVAAAEDLGALRDALAAARAAARVAVEREHGLRAAEILGAIAARREDPRPALRHEVQDALAELAEERLLLDALARAWTGASADGQQVVERVLVALVPAAGWTLLDIARRDRRAELVLLADRIGALTDAAGEALAADPSPTVVSLLLTALSETQRPIATVERWLAVAMRHAHPDVRALALGVAAQRSPQLADRGASHATPVKDHS
jgi:hypothetical protein